jgi:5-methylthioadenosine/S-adenosylhomocysteine deaminase
MRARIGLPLLDQATRWAGDFDEYLDKGLAVVKEFAGEALIDFALAPHAPYSVSDSGLEHIAKVSASRGLRVHLHCLETRFDIEHSLHAHGVGPLERLERHGLLNAHLIAVHMTQLDERDIDRLAQSGTHVVHCPQSNLKLASGICPAPALLKAGVNVSVGTDGAASNNNLDLLEEARFAALLAKGASEDATALDALQAFDMMTINGAIALGMEEHIGSIEVGKQADLCAMNLAAPQTQPVHNLFSQIVYAASSAQFTDVWVAGKRVMMAGELETLDEAALLANADEWRVRLRRPAKQREVVL